MKSKSKLDRKRAEKEVARRIERRGLEKRDEKQSEVAK